MKLECTVKNVKCGGCVEAIENGLKNIPGVHSVCVTIESGVVQVEGDAINQQAVMEKLADLGYPPA